MGQRSYRWWFYDTFALGPRDWHSNAIKGSRISLLDLPVVTHGNKVIQNSESGKKKERLLRIRMSYFTTKMFQCGVSYETGTNKLLIASHNWVTKPRRRKKVVQNNGKYSRFLPLCIYFTNEQWRFDFVTFFIIKLYTLMAQRTTNKRKLWLRLWTTLCSSTSSHFIGN